MKRIAVILIMLLLLSAVCGCSEAQERGFVMRVLNTGKSDCIIMQIDGECVICDSADDDDFVNIRKTLKENGINKVKALILTHFDKDHIGSADMIVSMFEVEVVFAPFYAKESDEMLQLQQATEETDTEFKQILENQKLKVGQADITIYTPQKTEYDDENNYSLITTVKYNDTSVLLMGDAMKERTEEFFSVCNDTFDVIKIAHHGEYNKPTDRLLSNSMGATGIITCNENKDTVEEKLIDCARKNNITLLYNCDGDIVFEYEDGKLVQK